MKKNEHLIKLALSSVFLALAYVLPFLTGQIQQIGNMLCPMHIPVLLCGFVCGAPWGVAVGIIAPLLRSLTLGMPVLFPNAVSMAFELAVYGFMTGLLYKALPKKKGFIYISLLISMIAGRGIWGIVQFSLIGFDATKFGFSAFIAGAVTNAVPGIILQIVLVPILVMVIEKVNINAQKA
ncbi:MAG: ECF transporter S component [Clostridia bacterium]|nr:ECF transporter S component [Clostridia bacterium]